MPRNCWDHRSPSKGALASTCKECPYRQKITTKRIPDDVRCWEYLNCDETCTIRDSLLLDQQGASKGSGLIGRGRRVLVLDDSKTLRNLVKLILEEYEYEVETASNGREGLEKTNKWHPDLMICDINLSGSSLSGLDVLGQVQRFRRKLKVVMLSSKADRETVEFCLKNGATAFVPKPFKNDELVKRVSQALRSE